MNKVILGFIFCVILSAAAYADTAEVLRDLQENLSQVKTIQSGFVQEKYLAIFNEKLILKGRIYLQKPQNFSWRLDVPLQYSMVIKKDKIRQWDAQSNQVQEISLDDNPIFNAVVIQLKLWFYGDYAQLLKDYSVTQLKDSPRPPTPGMDLVPQQSTQGRGLPVVLEFIPKETSVARSVIDKIIVSFREDKRYIKRIEIEEKNHDRTVLEFINTRINDPIDGKVWEVKQ
ncbi:MAG: outer membrane lipoprotein carrier protein LolA [Candidatus Omnitrophica bacterium]|nr:outer membrane lipoprotein carrier protein LolA [Candidatus Omnitrophota bacterium]MBU1811130.1 outer membrane lipoprotein carrier protein LolA [Candidatus Omnitrophota bacterium]